MTSLDKGSRALEGVKWKLAVVDGALITVWRATTPGHQKVQGYESSTCESREREVLYCSYQRMQIPRGEGVWRKGVKGVNSA